MSTPARAVLLEKADPVADIARQMIYLKQANGNLHYALALAEENEQRRPMVIYGLKRLIQKGAIGAATTAQTGWASETAQYGPGGQAFAIVQSEAIFGQVARRARRVPWRVAVPSETGSGGTAAWRGEGLPSVVTKSTTATFNMEYREVSVITLISQELFRFGPTSEALLVAMVMADVKRAVDTGLLDPTITATTARPASLTNGAQPITSTGSTAAQIVADLAGMIALIQTSGDGLVWIMRPLTYYTIAARFAGAGMPITPGFLLGIPVILGSTSPKQITLLDASNVAVSFDEEVDLDLSTEASVQADTAPTQSGVSGTGSTMLSLMQTNLVGIRAALPASWHTIRYATGSPTVSAGASYMTVTY